MEVDELIERFKALDLSARPESEIRRLFNELGKMVGLNVTYHKGKVVTRARINYEGVEFRQKKEFSFKPEKYNSTYQRASTPNKTMFYATSIPDKLEQGELDNMRVIGLAETVPFMRDPSIKTGYQKISFGLWEVVEDINLIAIVHKETYQKESNYTRELVSAYNNYIKNVPPEIANKSLKFFTYLADEFAKEAIKDDCDYDYMISAIFSELTAKQGLDGIIYPSVRAAGKGFNIAITPEATKKLKLNVAGECSVVKFGDTTYMGNDAIAELTGNETNDERFEMTPMNQGLERILNQLGLEDVKQLIP